MSSSKQQIGLCLVYLACLSWFASSHALGKIVDSDSLQVHSNGASSRSVHDVNHASTASRLKGRRLAKAGATGGEHGGGGSATPDNGGGNRPGGAAVIPVITGGAANNNRNHKSHHNGGNSNVKNCMASPILILIVLASHLVQWYT